MSHDNQCQGVENYLLQQNTSYIDFDHFDWAYSTLPPHIHTVTLSSVKGD